jgi:TrmH family RNA methyltransferase
MITSTKNSKIQWIRTLQKQSKERREAGAFVVEGVRLVEEALGSGWEPLQIFYTAGLSSTGMDLVSRAVNLGVPVETAAPAVLKAASDTETPQGILAVIRQKSLDLPVKPDFLLIVDAVRDPGNLGTILRTAAAAGVQAVLLPAGTVDHFSPKVLRSGMGAHFRLPVHSLNWDEIQQYLSGLEDGLPAMYIADSGSGQPYTQADFRSPLVLIIGGEAEGAGEQADLIANRHVHIPMPGGTESLNVAVAAAVLMFEVVRQRAEGRAQKSVD